MFSSPGRMRGTEGPAIIDSHAHVDARQFDADRDDVLARARAAGLALLVNVGCDVASSRRSVELAERHPDVLATVGIHPHEAARTGEDDWSAIEALAAHPRVVAVGECGLDRGPWNDAPLELQERLLRRHVGLSRRTGLPLVIHNRDTFPDLFRILEDETRLGGPLAGVMHCFSGGPDEARRCLDLGFHLSFSGVLTFKNADALREAARIAPLDRVFVETDCPYLTPEPHRGRRNEPAYVVHTARRLADVLGVPHDALERATDANVRRLFRPRGEAAA